DDIRDYLVTGFQTCALPISIGPAPKITTHRPSGLYSVAACTAFPNGSSTQATSTGTTAGSLIQAQEAGMAMYSAKPPSRCTPMKIGRATCRVSGTNSTITII